MQGVDLGCALGMGVERLHRVETFFVTRQVGLQVVGMHQVQRRAMQAFIDPGQACAVEGVGEYADDRIVVTQQDEFSLEALGQGHPVEHRGGTEQAVGVEHRVVQGYTQALDERHGSQFTQRPEGVQHPLAGTGGQGAGLGQLFTGETSRYTFHLRRFYGKG
ncbi:hypothetical protein D3C76_387950 [compost metagenome]